LSLATAAGDRGQAGSTPATGRRLTRATFHLPEPLLNEVRNAVVALSGPPERMTMASFAEAAFRHELERLTAARGGRSNGSGFFPQRSAPVRTGRPIG
jgi:hypothetical protein